MIKKLIFSLALSFMLFGYMTMAADTSGGIGPWIGELGSGALVVLALFVMAKYIFKPMKELFKSLSTGLDKNTEAVRAAVQHNEDIISNHLASEKARWEHVTNLLEPLTTEIRVLNKWHRDNGK